MKIEKVEKLVASLHDKTEYVIHLRNLKQALNHALVQKKVHKVIKFNQNGWLKPNIDMNTDLRKKAKTDFEKDFFKDFLMSNDLFGKNLKSMGKHRDIKLVTNEGRRNYVVSEPNQHTTHFFKENLLATEMKKTDIHMNKPVHLGLSILGLGLSILELSKTLIYNFWYDYVKAKYDEKVKLSYMDINSFIVYIKQMIFIKTLQI